MVAAIAGVTEDCEEPQLDWKTVASIDHVGSTWFMRCHGAHMVHLQHLQGHRVYEELDLPPGVKPLSVRWVDKDDYSTAKARLTARGQEQELTGQENFHSATPRSATLRRLLWRSEIALKLFSKHQSSRSAMYGSRLPLEAAVEPGASMAFAQDTARPEGRTSCMGTPRDEGQGGALLSDPECARPVRAQQHA